VLVSAIGVVRQSTGRAGPEGPVFAPIVGPVERFGYLEAGE